MSSETILIVRPGALGDTILSLPLLASIRSAYPQAKITFLGNPSYQNLLPADIEFHSIDAARWTWLFESVNPGQSRAAFDRAYVILKNADAVATNLVKSGTKLVFTASSSPVQGKHLVESLHEAFGLNVPPRRPALAELAPRAKSDLVWIHPGSGGSKKCIPLVTMRRLTDAIQRETGLSVAVTAGEADGFLRALPDWERLVRGPRAYLMENKPIAELCKQLGGARLFMGNDSGISHLAAGLGVPSSVFFVASDPIQWAPWVPPERLRIIDCSESRSSWFDLESEMREILDFFHVGAVF
ncbi:MAG: glycosyltransferase family 9 protein [Desulfomonilaceae bacterium]